MDEDNEVFGLDMYNEKIEEPQATNAIRACVLNDFKEIEKVTNSPLRKFLNSALGDIEAS